MASFFEDLWMSVFTPGTSSTLLVATNVSFAALQLLLFVLLIFTYSIHFVVLSLLSGSLWWAINWFVAEVRVSQAAQEKEARKAEAAARAVDPAESETETESVTGVSPAPPGSMRPPPVPAKASGASVSGSSPGLSRSTEDVRQRYNPVESSGYISTDSEWEKVDEKEK
jgi:anaphase-promoting complex subunit 2